MKDEEARVLFEQNVKLAYVCAKRMYSDKCPFEDTQQMALIGLWKACLSFDAAKGKFSAYAITCMANEVKMYWRKLAIQTQGIVSSLDAPVTSEYEEFTLADILEDPAQRVETSTIFFLDFYFSCTEREKQWIKWRLQGMSQAECARQIGVTQSYFSRLMSDLHRRYSKGRWNDSVRSS